MKKLVNLLVLTLITTTTVLYGQYSELSIAAGISNYWGDLNPSQASTNFDQSRLNVSLGYHYHFDNGIGIRGDLSFLGLKNSDSLNEDEQNRQRNLSFSNNVFEFAILGELHPIELFTRLKTPRISPYGVLGVSVFYYEPTTEYQGTTVNLRPLGTEGQGIEGFDDPYSPVGIAIPGGAGLRFYLTDNLALSLEGILRYTFTDYIDDVSGLYPSYQVVLDNNGELAAALSERNDEFLGEAEGSQNGRFVGSMRGGADVDDYFSSINLRLHFYLGRGAQSPFNFLGGNKTECPKF